MTNDCSFGMFLLVHVLFNSLHLRTNLIGSFTSIINTRQFTVKSCSPVRRFVCWLCLFTPLFLGNKREQPITEAKLLRPWATKAIFCFLKKKIILKMTSQVIMADLLECGLVVNKVNRDTLLQLHVVVCSWEPWQQLSPALMRHISLIPFQICWIINCSKSRHSVQLDLKTNMRLFSFLRMPQVLSVHSCKAPSISLIFRGSGRAQAAERYRDLRAALLLYRSRNVWACLDVTWFESKLNGLRILSNGPSRPASGRTMERVHLPWPDQVRGL